jgi:hypothetical protein
MNNMIHYATKILNKRIPADLPPDMESPSQEMLETLLWEEEQKNNQEN